MSSPARVKNLLFRLELSKVNEGHRSSIFKYSETFKVPLLLLKNYVKPTIIYL